jgi:hypothetical protein
LDIDIGRRHGFEHATLTAAFSYICRCNFKTWPSRLFFWMPLSIYPPITFGFFSGVFTKCSPVQPSDWISLSQDNFFRLNFSFSRSKIGQISSKGAGPLCSCADYMLPGHCSFPWGWAMLWLALGQTTHALSISKKPSKPTRACQALNQGIYLHKYYISS